MNILWQDVRYGLRILVKRPGFTLVAVITLALGIGANTAIFSVINAVLIRPLPYKQPERLVKVWPQKAHISASKAEMAAISEHSQSFSDLAAYSGWSFTLTGGSEPAKLSGARTTATFFSLLGVDAELGRTFLPDEDRPERSRVVLLSHGLWQSRFGADQNIIGQAITIDGESHTIVGVLRPDFKFPDNQFAKFNLELVVPAQLDPTDKNDYTAGYLNLIGQLQAGVTPEQAQAEVASIIHNSREKIGRVPDNYGQLASVKPLQDEMIGDTRPTLLILLGAVAFVLLIACANVANLYLARTTARRREIAIRAALGAGRGRIIRQLLTESFMLAAAGGAAGVLLALWGIDLLVALLPAEVPRLNAIGLDGRVLGFSLGISLLTGILFGLAPALQASSPDLQAALKESGKSVTTSAGRRMRNLLVVAEVALALMLVIGAGLLIKSFWRRQQVDPGFKAENVLSLQVAPPSAAYEKPERKRTLYRQILERVSALPGVKAVGGIHLLPMGGSNWDPDIRVEDQPVPDGEESPSVDWRLVTRGYFQAMGIALIRGRFFTEADHEKAPSVAIINETLARRYWPNSDPIGKRVRSGFEGKEWVPIVGVVADVKEQGLDVPTHLELYRPYDQAPYPSAITLMVRTDADPAALASAIRSEIWAVDKDVPLADVQPLSKVVSESLARPRSTMLLLAIFAGVALILGSIGIYGVVAYAVAQRTQEIGIRMALGASSKAVLRMVLGQGMSLILTGIVLGLGCAVAATRVLESLLFGVSSLDLFTFAAVSVLLTGVALAACLVPARRAMKVDPMVALRYE